MAKFFSPNRPSVEASSLRDAAEIYGKMICRPIAYGAPEAVASMVKVLTK